MLNMTYVKYIESNLLCFIPGKVLDEMKYVLDLVDSDETPPRTHQLLQELRDLSSMAMEHFDEHILPSIKEQIDRKTSISLSSALSTIKSSPKLFYGSNALSNELYKMKKQGRSHKHCISYLSQSTQKLCQKVRKQNIYIKAQTMKMKDQERKIKEQNTKIQEQETALAEIKKHIDEWDQKYTDLTNELVRARDDILAATAAATQRPSTSPLSGCPSSPTKLFKSNIKPRITHILPKNYINVQLDLDRKRKSNLLPEIPLKRKTPETDDNRKENQLNINIPDIVNLDNVRVESNKQENDSPESTGSPLSRNELESLCSFSLFRHPICRKRKMQEDIDLK